MNNVKKYNVTITFGITKDFQKQLFLESKNYDEKQEIDILTDNKVIIDAANLSNNVLFINLYQKNLFKKYTLHTSYGKPYIEKYTDYIYFSKTPTEEDIIKAITEPPISTELQEELKIEIDTYNQNQKLKEKEKLEKEKLNQFIEEKKATIIKNRENERLEWIEKNGSEHIKKMVTQKYEYKMTYEIERGKKEIPEAKYNENEDYFEWKDRANPFKKSLDKAEKYITIYGEENVRIVLARVYHEERYDYEDDFKEAIRITPDWSRYSFFIFV